MLDLPVLVHLSRLVTGLADRSEAEHDAGDDEEQVASDETPEKDTPTSSESTSSNDSDRSRRRPKRIHRVGHGKTKRWRESNTILYGANPGLRRNFRQNPSQYLLKSRVGASLGGADPFGAFELPQESTTDLALHHWLTVFQNTRMPITPRHAWMKINLSDKTLLSVTTYCSAYHFYFIRGMRAPPVCLNQKVNAIRNINNALTKPGSIPSDHIMVAVAVMTILECLGGEPTASFVHRKGLQLMVYSRGGLQNLGFDGAAQRTISWADTCCAILLRAKPTLKPILIPDAGESAIRGFTVGNLKARLLLLKTSPDLCQKIIYIWLRLRYLTEFLASIPDKQSSIIDDYFFSDKLDFIERQTLLVLHSDSLAESTSVAFFTAFLNASLIYIYEELRECPKWNNLCICLSERIYSGLQMVDLSSVAKHCPDLLLWILLLGRSGNSPLGEISRLWYLDSIVDMEDKMGITIPKTVAGLKYFELAEATRQSGSQSGVKSSKRSSLGGAAG